MEISKEKLLICAEILLSLVAMENNPLRGLLGVSSPRPVEQIVAPQPTEPSENENVYFEIPSGMIE